MSIIQLHSKCKLGHKCIIIKYAWNRVCVCVWSAQVKAKSSFLSLLHPDNLTEPCCLMAIN